MKNTQTKRKVGNRYGGQGQGGTCVRDREADHRIANSLAFLSAALKLESRRITSIEAARTALTGAAYRIDAISRVHHALSRNGHDGTMPLLPYLSDLTRDLSKSYDIDVRLDGEELSVPVDLAGCLAVVISEMATNSVKHATARGRIVVDVTFSADHDGVLTVIVGDNGDGFPETFDMEDTAGLGMAIVTATVRQHKGTVTPQNGPGATYRIELPNPGHAITAR
jgi:two-component sensor histidine kinase